MINMIWQIINGKTIFEMIETMIDIVIFVFIFNMISTNDIIFTTWTYVGLILTIVILGIVKSRVSK